MFVFINKHIYIYIYIYRFKLMININKQIIRTRIIINVWHWGLCSLENLFTLSMDTLIVKTANHRIHNHFFFVYLGCPTNKLKYCVSGIFSWMTASIYWSREKLPPPPQPLGQFLRLYSCTDDNAPTFKLWWASLAPLLLTRASSGHRCCIIEILLV